MKRGRSSRYVSDDSDGDDSRSDDRTKKSARQEEGEKRVPIPDDSDMNFLMQLFDKTVSKYIDTIFEETGIRAQLIAMPRGGKHHFMLRGNAAKLVGAARAVEKLLALSGRERAQLLQSSYIGDAPLLDEADTAPPPTMAGIEPRVQTSRMDFSKLNQTMETPKETVKVPPEMVRFVCTAKNKRVLLESTGAEVEFTGTSITVAGTKIQRQKAQQVLKRAVTHCIWGVSESKVERLLSPKKMTWAMCRLSPMSNLTKFERNLNEAHPVITIGKDTGMDLIIPNSHISRQHCVIEFDMKRSGVYIIDCSTNGTFLNGKRLPAKSSGKVLLSHGDEINLKSPNEDPEFGYIVNFQWG